MIDSAPASTDAGSAGGEETVMRWYVLKVQSNREKSIRDNLMRRVRQEGLEQYFGKILIPTEKVIDTKSGKKRVTEQKLYPGYLMVQMILNDDTWYLVRTANGVGDFTGAAGKPIPMQEDEIARILGNEEQKVVRDDKPLKVKVEFQPHDMVKIKDGTFEGFEGEVDSINEATGKVKVLIQIFGRPSPVELDHWQVERV